MDETKQTARHTWDAAYCGLCRIFAGACRDFLLYNDAGYLDYVDTAIAPDGRFVRSRDFDEGENLIWDNLLSKTERQTLLALLEAAK